MTDEESATQSTLSRLKSCTSGTADESIAAAMEFQNLMSLRRENDDDKRMAKKNYDRGPLDKDS
jgi:hypothetical protein